MSQPKTEMLSAHPSAESNAAILALHQMISQGRSFSGHERKCVFLNTGGPRFACVSAVTGIDFPDDGRALAVTDWDLDGDLDLWMVNRSGPQVRYLRNDIGAARHFLAVHLVGTTANRDAIGARVELLLDSDAERKEGKRARTLCAGSGFLAQSSKWVHFGLGAAEGAGRLRVRWPGGATEEFPVRAGGRYVVVQGRGKAEPWTPPARNDATAPSTLEAAKSTEASRTFLLARVFLPPMNFTDWDGRSVPLSEYASRPVLLLLWTSTCRACVEELGELARREPEIRAAGLDVLALCVEDGGGDRPRRTVERAGFHFGSGLAGADLVRKLEIVHGQLFDRMRPLPVPTGFLLQERGRLAAVYKGRVSVDRLLDDARHLDAPPDRRWEWAAPFPGKWHASPAHADLRAVENRVTDESLVQDVMSLARSRLSLKADDAAGQAERQATLDRVRDAVTSKLDRAQVYVDHAAAALAKGNLDDAEMLYRLALGLEAKNARACEGLGSALEKQGRFAEALAQFARAAELDPASTAGASAERVRKRMGKSRED